MILKPSRLFALATLLVSPLGVIANDIYEPQEHYIALPAATPVVLDGSLDEWNTSTLLQDPLFYTPKGAGNTGQLGSFEALGGDWTGTQDHSVGMMVSYDADNVYVGLLVIDDYHENSANSAWNGDSVQMMVANGARDTQVGLYNFALGGVENALGGIVNMLEAGPGGAEVAVTRGFPVTMYEIKLPMSSLGLSELSPGVQFGLGMAINDGDQNAPGQQGWSGFGPHALVFGKSPAETGLITLGVPEPATIGIALVGVGSLLLSRRRRV
jgi:hypothetical protein